MFQKYCELQKISFDYAVVEKESSINVIRFNGSWEDLGTWNTLTEAMDEPVNGNAVTDDCENTHVINELGIPVIAYIFRRVSTTCTEKMHHHNGNCVPSTN